MHKYITTNLIAFDFDGVIHNNCYTGCNSQIMDSDSDFGSVMDGALECIKSLQDLGFPVVIMSARKKHSIKKWLSGRIESKNLGLKFKCLPFWVRRYDNNQIIGITNTKMIAKMYIDDRTLQFNGKFTDKFTKDILNFEPWHKKLNQMKNT